MPRSPELSERFVGVDLLGATISVANFRSTLFLLSMSTPTLF